MFITPRHKLTQPRRGGERTSQQRGGFTLIEAALATVIVGVGVLAIVAAQQAYHIKNDWAQKQGQAAMLANEIRELTLNLPMHDPLTGAFGHGTKQLDPTNYTNLGDFAQTVTSGVGSATFNPPIDAQGHAIPDDDLKAWSQHVKVESVSPTVFGSPTGVFTPLLLGADTGADPQLLRFTVTVFYKAPGEADPGEALTTLSWVAGDND